ncbi:MAG: transposase [Kiritimatiellia bacterium]
MARHLRVEFPGAIYHVACRMIGDDRIERSRLFTEDTERERFVERLGERVEEYDVRLYLFVLMTNHFHLVFETPEGNCSRFMHSLLTSYTVYYNLRHGRHGHLFDGRFKGKLVEGDEYLLKLSRYVHLNPVMVGDTRDRPMEERVKGLREYPWSTYAGYIGRRKKYDFVSDGPVLAEIGGNGKAKQEQYRAFVESGLAENDEEFEAAIKASPRSIGGEGFRRWIDELYQKMTDRHGVKEDVAFRRITEPLDTATVIDVLGEELGVQSEDLCRRRRGSKLRAIAARCLMRYAGQTQRDVARLLGVGSGSAISKQLAVYGSELDRGLEGKILARLDRRLTEERRKRHADVAKSYLKG